MKDDGHTSAGSSAGGRDVPSNQGRDFEALLDIVSIADLQDIAGVMWTEIKRHPPTSSCECPAVEALCRLRELGYEITKAP